MLTQCNNGEAMMARDTKFRKAKRKAKPQTARARRSARKPRMAARMEAPNATPRRVDGERRNDVGTSLSPLGSAPISWDAARFAWGIFQTVSLLSFQSMRTWQDAWFGLMRLDR
jgi:hypothetical protein